MGKIKPKSVRKSVETLSKEEIEFSNNFEGNKKVLKGMAISKKLRNQLAGLMTKKKKTENGRS